MARRVREQPADYLAARPTGWVRRANELAAYAGPLLLDTHVWLWYVTGDSDRISVDTRALLDRVGRDQRLLVSDMSYWEVAVKAAKGKLPLGLDAAIWLQQAEQTPGIQWRPLTRAVLLLSTRLHGLGHQDPVDRVLIAYAQLEGVPLVTADRLLIDYARTTGTLAVVDVRRAR